MNDRTLRRLARTGYIVRGGIYVIVVRGWAKVSEFTATTSAGSAPTGTEARPWRKGRATTNSGRRWVGAIRSDGPRFREGNQHGRSVLPHNLEGMCEVYDA